MFNECLLVAYFHLLVLTNQSMVADPVAVYYIGWFEVFAVCSGIAVNLLPIFYGLLREVYYKARNRMAKKSSRIVEVKSESSLSLANEPLSKPDVKEPVKQKQ